MGGDAAVTMDREQAWPGKHSPRIALAAEPGDFEELSEHLEEFIDHYYNRLRLLDGRGSESKSELRPSEPTRL